MKRWLAVALTLCLGAAQAQDVREVTFWTGHGEPDLSVLQSIVDSFNEENPDIRVELVQIPPGDVTDVTRLMTAVRGGTGPDVYMLDRFIVAQRAAERAVARRALPVLPRAGSPWKDAPAGDLVADAVRPAIIGQVVELLQAALDPGQLVTDTLTVTSLDGTASETITVTVTDVNGNVRTCAVPVTITDDTPPVGPGRTSPTGPLSRASPRWQAPSRTRGTSWSTCGVPCWHSPRSAGSCDGAVTMCSVSPPGCRCHASGRSCG